MSKVLHIVNIVVINPAGDALILRRSKTHPSLAFHKDLPGGIVDRGETTLMAATRELKEETGIEIDPVDLEQIYAAHHPTLLKHEYRTLYSVQLQSDTPVTISWEHDLYSWQPISTIATIEGHAQAFFKAALQHFPQAA